MEIIFSHVKQSKCSTISTCKMKDTQHLCSLISLPFSAHASLRDHAILTCKNITSMSQNTFEFNYKRLLSSHILCSISMLTYYYTSSSSPESSGLDPRGLSFTQHGALWRQRLFVSKLSLRMSGQALHAPLALFTFSIEYKSKSFSNTQETKTSFWHKLNWSYKTMHFRAASAAK